MKTFNMQEHRQPANQPAATRKPRLAPRSKPRRFRQTRMLIVGCGQVGQTLLQLYPNRHFIASYRPGADANAKRFHLRSLNALPLALNHQNLADIRRAVALARRIIWLAPPSPHGKNQGLQQAALFARWHHHCHGGPTPRISYVSTTGVYGNSQGAWVDERTPVDPQTPRAQRRVNDEQQLKAELGQRYPHSTGGLHGHILRAPGIYGPQRLPLERLSQGLPVLLAQEDSWSNHIHEIDLARLCLWTQFKGQALEVINACDQQPMLMGDYFDCIARWAQLPCPPRLPKAIVQQLVSPMMWSFMGESRRVVSKRQQQLGFRLRYPTVADGLAATIDFIANTGYNDR